MRLLLHYKFDTVQYVDAEHTYMHSHLQMEIEVEGQIVVFDEGHNLEDVSREAASLTVTVPQLNTVIEECNDVIAGMLHLLIIL